MDNYYLDMWTSDDITFCMADCEKDCKRKPENIRCKDIPHSFSDLSKVCKAYKKASN